MKREREERERKRLLNLKRREQKYFLEKINCYFEILLSKIRLFLKFYVRYLILSSKKINKMINK